MGEWMRRAALIQCQSTSAEAGKREGELLQPPGSAGAEAEAEPDYRRYPERYELPRFAIPTTDGLVEFQLAVPKEKYDAFVVLDLFVRHHGLDASGQEGAQVE